MSSILVWSPNYAPEPIGIAPLVTDASEWLVQRGHRVDVVTALPNYPQRRIIPEYRGAIVRHELQRGVGLHRSWLRVRPQERFVDKALYEATFAVFSAPHALRRVRAADVVVAVVPTLLSAALAAAFAKATGKRFVIWLQDLVLEGALAVDGARLLGPARMLERRTMRAADQIVVCSAGFGAYLVTGGTPAGKIETIPNWVDVVRIVPTVRSQGRPPVVLYAGNIGYSQGFETVIDAARAAPELEFRIVGDGNASSRVAALAGETANVSVLPPVDHDAFPDLLAAADIHVVLQRSVSAGANLPSKIAPYLASGRPIAASLDPSTPAADLLRASGGAVLVPPERPAELAAALRRLAADPHECNRLARAGRAYAEAELARDRILPRLERALLP